MLNDRLEAWKQKNLYRSRHIADNKKRINFCSNDYLGLANHPNIVAAFQHGASLYGVGSTASQLICGHHAAHADLENYFADFIGAESALYFANGYMANLGVITTLAAKQDVIFQDRNNHASLLDAGLLSGARMHRYLHCDTNHLNGRLSKYPSSQKIIISDGVFSMDGDITPLGELMTLKSKHNSELVIDDAHGIGVLGKQGKGIIEESNVSINDITVGIYPLGKALGCYGAIVAGKKRLIESLIQFARSYIYTTALPPALAVAAQKSLKVMQKETWRREKLHENIDYFTSKVADASLAFQDSRTAIQALIIGDIQETLALSEKLNKKGFLVTAIREPTVPKNSSRLRITLSTTHSKQEIDGLIHAIKS